MKTQAAQDIPFIAAPRITTVAGYLLTRLAEVGVRSVFGVPGDCNLPILDAIAGRPELAWIGMATGQGAGYAAGSYARLRGIGALVTTFGAGELSAMNAIAGACAQSVPVVHIVGTPALAARQSGATLYHNLPGRDRGHFARMAAEVTAAQADLRPDTAPEEIDRVLNTALRTSRPVYLTIPADMADIPVLAPAGRLAGHLAPRRGEVHDLAVTGNLPVAVLSTANDVPEPRGARADLPPPDAAADARGGPLDQRKLWVGVRDLLRPGDLLIADQGTAFYGAAGLTLPSGAELIGQPLPAPVGWTVPAALGASLAAPDRRVVLVAGGGAMRQTAAELGTLLGQGLAPIIIVLSHDGYTAERAIGRPDAGYHQIPAWDRTARPATAGPAASVVALRASTSHELAWALNAASYHAGLGRPVLIEAVLDAGDVPAMFQDLTRVPVIPTHQ
jgi:TPP-dependent 2-oxoacid decarboxylase